MAEYKVRYKDDAERRRLIDDAVAKGHVLVHDDYEYTVGTDSEGNPVRERVGGVLTITDTPPPSPSLPPDYRALYAAAQTDSERIDIIARYLRLK